jgi:hypothetical protein
MSIKAMKQALEALERMKGYGNTFLYRRNEQSPYEQICEAITSLRKAIAEAEKQEPVAWIEHHKGGDNLNWEEVNHPYAKATPLYTHPQPQREPLTPVEGDLLPPVGSKVLIHLARQEEWVEHTVVGYYVWGGLDGRDERMHRVFVRVVSANGFLNARMLRDVRPIEAAHGIKEKNT